VGEPEASLVNGWELMSAGEQYLSSVVRVIERIADTQMTTIQLVGTSVGRSVVQVGYGARVNGVNGEIHSLVVNVLALSATRPATWAIFRSQTTLRAMTQFRQLWLSERES
jgi:hypothetical protein